MDREKLYNYLDIDTPADFEYFENMAALLECDEDIPYEEVYAIVTGAQKDNMVMLLDNYFEELSDFYPGGDAEFYLLMDKIKMSLMGLAQNSDEENIAVNFAEELNRFRHWYSVESRVVCTAVASGEERDETLRDALALARMEKLDGEKFIYDFTYCSDYQLDEYIMSFADIIAAAQSEE